MSKFVCDNGHINSTSHPDHDWKGMKCMECGEKLQTSPAVEALCARIEARNFKVVECVFEESTIQVPQGTVMKGPIEGALLVVLEREQVRNLVSCGGCIYQDFVDGVIGAVKGVGWDGEVMVISETMKMAKFELVP